MVASKKGFPVTPTAAADDQPALLNHLGYKVRSIFDELGIQAKRRYIRGRSLANPKGRGWVHASKSFFPDHLHQPVPEFLADGNLHLTDVDVVILDLIQLPDIDDIGMMHPGKGHRKLGFNIL
jgi:hypothetical protein